MAEDGSFDPRRRVLGAVVLVTAAVVFLPMVFKAPRVVAPGDDVLTVVRDGSGLRTQWHPASAPVTPVQAPAPGAVAPRQARAAAPRPPMAPVRPAAVAPPSAWLVQVGAYVNASDAIAFADRLKTQGFRVHMHLTPLAHGHGIVVTIGPYDRTAAGAAVRRVVRLDHVRGLVEPGPG